MAKKAMKPAKEKEKKSIRKAAVEQKAPAKAAAPAKSAKLQAKAVEEEIPVVDEDADEDALLAGVGAAGSASAGVSAGAAGAMSGPTLEGPGAGVRSFRHHPEIENFYRFIYENDLRYEALAIIEEILHEKKARKAIQLKKSKAH